MAKDTESNEKAVLTASLGLCHVRRDAKGKVAGGICPAKGGEMAFVEFHRHPTSIEIKSCRHHQFSGGQHPCEGHYNGLVCYHAKAILIQSGSESNHDVQFSPNPSEGSIPIFVHPGKIIYMKATERPAPAKDECEVCHGERGGVPGNENVIDGKIVCDNCHSKIMAERNSPAAPPMPPPKPVPAAPDEPDKKTNPSTPKPKPPGRKTAKKDK